MNQPPPTEEYITIIDNKGQEKIQRVEYVVHDVRGEKVYVTTDGLTYTEDSLTRKRQYYLVKRLDKIPDILSKPDIVIWDPADVPSETLIYYKRLYVAELRRNRLVAAIVKVRQGIKFFYNLHAQESGKVKGLSVVPSSEIEVWYIAPHCKKRQFGL